MSENTADNQATDYDAMKQAIESDPSSSYWLKSAVVALDSRDPVDAENDVLALARLCIERNNVLIPPNDPGNVQAGTKA